MIRPPPRSPFFPYPPLFRPPATAPPPTLHPMTDFDPSEPAILHDRISDTIIAWSGEDRKSTRLNSSHSQISYAVFCLKKKNCHGTERLIHFPTHRAFVMVVA